jgi:hypothetical protein
MNAMKELIILFLILTIFLSTILPAQAATVNSPSLSGIQIFPKDNIWNTRVDKLPVDTKSAIYIMDLKKDTLSNPGLRTYIRNAIPYNVVNSTQRHQYLKTITYFPYSDNVPFPIPANPLYELGCADYHMEIIDVDEMVLYELSAARQNSDGSWSAGMAAVWDLKGNSFRKNNETPMWATNEAGLPKFPGLIRYDEVSAGHIDHALAIGVPAMQNTWVWPARSAILSDPSDPSHLPAGQRLRLKSSFDISGYPPQAKVILQALKTYGAMVHTNNGGNSVGIAGSPDTRWNFNDLESLKGVDISNFEAVDVSSVMIDKNSAQARQIPVVSPTPPQTSSIIVTSPNGAEKWQRGTSRTVSWSYIGSPGSTVKITLFKAGSEVGTISAGISIGSGGTGSYTWPISSSGTMDSDYKVSVQSISQSAIKDTSNNYFTLTEGSSIDKVFQFGLTGDTPVVGDWNSDGKDDIGIFRPGKGIWSLDSDGNYISEVSDTSLRWGLIGDTPVVGDWNGDGKDDIGIFRPSSGIWSLDSNGNNKWDVSDKSLRWGLIGDTPVVGDWNGDGKDDIGIFRPNKGIWSLDSDGNNKWDISDKSLSWGIPDDNPVIGDWNGNGKDDIGIFRPNKGIWSLDSNGNHKWDIS